MLYAVTVAVQTKPGETRYECYIIKAESYLAADDKAIGLSCEAAGCPTSAARILSNHSIFPETDPHNLVAVWTRIMT
jgi:hypothetical protein